jgi:superfamily II DNA or RNA helicase
MQPLFLLCRWYDRLFPMYYKNDVLRDYQQEMKVRLFEEWNLHRNVMIQMPTGTGKTHLLTAIVREFLHRSDTQVWIVAHRRELVEQIEETVAKYGIKKEAEAVKVMSIQWLSRNWKDIDREPGLIVIDEAHHALAETYRELWERYPEARKLGMTATPCRLNRKGFTELFDALITSWSISEFIGKGWLSVFDYVSIRANSVEQRLIDTLRKRGADGDYQVKEMNELLNRRSGIGRLYESIEKYASGKKGIVYAISIAHARQIATYYSVRGVMAVAIDSKTPALERKRLVEGFRQGKIKVLVNVDIFSEGFDCPDVEFIQLARPTLSLAKYLQQVGRGLRKSGNKESCMLIDNVGLYRIFGLPTRKWDWKAMFEGRIIGNAMSRARMENSWTAPYLPVENEAQDDELEVVITHSQLMETIKNKESVASEKEAYPSLKAHYDRQTGLWGLRRGERMTAKPQYVEVFDTKGDWAAVRFEDHRMGIVDDSGESRIRIDRSRKLKFLKEDIIAVTDNNGNDFYIDLKVNRTYKEKPAVLSFGSVELLRVGDVFLSRTKKPYATMRGLDINSIYFYGFYLKIPDYRAPRDCKLVDAVWSTLFDVFACLLEGDDEEVYWCCGHLADRSIVVVDGNGNYYHVEKGKKKQYIACNVPKPGEEDFDRVVGRLKEEAMQRAERTYQQQQLEEELKRQKRLEEIRDVLPFQMGLKWGLKLGERIVVPPKYRKILPPVGYYCAYEENTCQWGVMALDGKVMVEARYQEVDIECNGTVHLTIIPGKVKTIKL